MRQCGWNETKIWVSVKRNGPDFHKITFSFRKISFSFFWAHLYSAPLFIYFMILKPYINELYCRLSFSWRGAVTLVLSCQPEPKQADVEVNWRDSPLGAGLHSLTSESERMQGKPSGSDLWPFIDSITCHLEQKIDGSQIAFLLLTGRTEIRMQCGETKEAARLKRYRIMYLNRVDLDALERNNTLLTCFIPNKSTISVQLNCVAGGIIKRPRILKSNKGMKYAIQAGGVF